MQNVFEMIPEADRCTIFLDEIGDLPLGLQAKQLRVLENILEHVLILGRKGPIELNHCPGHMSKTALIAAPTPTTLAD